MERRDRAPGLDHPRLEVAAAALVFVARYFVSCPGLHPVEEPAEGRGLRNVEVVAGEQSHAGAPAQRREHGLVQELEPAVLDECRENRDVARTGEQWPDMAEEGVVRSPDRQRPHGRSQVVPLSGNHVAHAAPWIVHIT